MALRESSICIINKINSKGLGESFTEKGPIFLPFVMEGEKVEFERHNYRGKESFVLKNIAAASKDRSSPLCKFYQSCGGCLLQHFSEKTYIEYKSKILKEIIGEEVPVIFLDNHKRRRLNLVFKSTNQKLLLGFYRYKSNNIVNIDSCIASEDKISNLIPSIRMLLEKICLDGDSGEIFILSADNGIDVKIKLESKERFNEVNRRKLKSFFGTHGVIRVSYFHNKNEIVKIMEEVPYVNFGGENVQVEADSFLQATKESDRVISNLVLDYIGDSENKTIADLFCGRGTLTIPLMKKGHKVLGYENDKNSLIALSNASSGVDVELRDLHYNPLDVELTKFDIIVLNPPRSGAEQQVKNIVNRNCAEKLIYVSCSLKSFMRDYSILKTNYRIKNLVAIDQFKWNPHIEIIAQFEKITK